MLKCACLLKNQSKVEVQLKICSAALLKFMPCFPMPSLSSIQMGSPPLVKAAATVLKDLCYSNREDLSAGFITAGWDKKKGPQV